MISRTVRWKKTKFRIPRDLKSSSLAKISRSTSVEVRNRPRLAESSDLISKLQDHGRDVYVQNSIFMHFFCWKGFPCRYWTRLAEMGSLGECSSNSSNSSMGSMGAKVSPLTDLFEQHSSISLPQKLETCLVSGNDVRFERKQRMEALDYWHFTVLCLSLVVKNATCLDVLVTSVHPCHFARCEPGRVRCAVVMSQGSSPVTICWSRCITRQHRRVGFQRLKEGLMKTWKHATCSKLMQSSQGGAPLVSSSGQKLDIDLFTLMWVGCTAAS